MADHISFGDSDRYYAIESLRASEYKSPEHAATERFIQSLLYAFDPELPNRVRRIYRQWNNAVREYLRTETALRLSVEEKRQSVPIVVKDGLPLPFADILKGWNQAIWDLYLHRRQITASIEGLEVIKRNLDYLKSLSEFQDIQVDQNTVGDVQELVKRVEKLLEKLSLLKRIRDINEDILGAYFFRGPQIQLYWMVIGLLAGVLNVSVEALTVVVLAHELAHAYTHLGYDIDGIQWKTESFAQTDLRIVEGLAQFYTEVTCKKLEPRFPPAKQAYEAFLSIQGGPYVTYKQWVSDEDQPGELVRFSMINTRSQNIKEYGGFLEALEIAQERIRREDRTLF